MTPSAGASGLDRGELVCMNQAMILTWLILGAGGLLIALSAPYALPELRAFLAQWRAALN